jgi:hypothetical protein
MTRARLMMIAGLVVLLVVTVLVILVDDSRSEPPRLRERIVLEDGVSSELTGAVVSIDGDPMILDVVVGDEILCSFEVIRPKNHLASRDGDTWLVLVRRVDTDLRTVDVRVDRIPASGEPDGCRTEEPVRGG